MASTGALGFRSGALLGGLQQHKIGRPCRYSCVRLSKVHPLQCTWRLVRHLFRSKRRLHKSYLGDTRQPVGLSSPSHCSHWLCAAGLLEPARSQQQPLLLTRTFQRNPPKLQWHEIRRPKTWSRTMWTALHSQQKIRSTTQLVLPSVSPAVQGVLSAALSEAVDLPAMTFISLDSTAELAG